MLFSSVPRLIRKELPGESVDDSITDLHCLVNRLHLAYTIDHALGTTG